MTVAWIDCVALPLDALHFAVSPAPTFLGFLPCLMIYPFAL